MKRILILITFVLLVGPTSVQTRAQMLLKPSGGAYMPLRLKSVNADVVIDGQFASTNLNMVFHNESKHRLEADFVYTLPDGAIATYFAYWAEEEKVVARIVEKERATQIYDYITTRQRDPALIEVTGKNTFRARIFPIFPNADLRVEIRLAHALPTVSGDIVYTLPAVYDGDKDTKLENVNVGVRVKEKPYIISVTNNFGLPIEKTGNVYGILFSGTNYRFQKELTVRLKRESKPLLVSEYAAPAGGNDGFFALALTPDHSLEDIKVTFKGLSTYDVVLPEKSVKVGQRLLVVGRYKGAGSVDVLLAGKSPIGVLKYNDTLNFGSEPRADNVAALLWASNRITQLSANPVNRNTIVKLSKQFGMPSKYTSWLAVPKAEMEMYKREMAELEIAKLIRALAVLNADGKQSSVQAKSIKKQLYSLCKTHGWNADELIAWKMGYYSRGYAYEWTDSLLELVKHGKGDSKQARQLRSRITRAIGTEAGQQIKDKADELLNHLCNELTVEKYSQKPNAAKMNSLRAQINRLGKTAGISIKKRTKEVEDNHFYWAIRDLAYELAEEKYDDKPDAKKISALNARIQHLQQFTQTPAAKILEEVEDGYFGYLISSLAYELAKEKYDDKPDTKKISALNARIQHLQQFVNEPVADNIRKAEENNATHFQWRLVEKIVVEKLGKDPDFEKIAYLEGKLAELEKLSGRSSKEITDSYINNYAHLHNPWVFQEIATVRDQLIRALNEKHSDQDKLNDLKKYFVELNTRYKGREYAEARLERLEAQERLRNVYDEEHIAHQNDDKETLARLTPEREKLEKRVEELRARMGDPLISVDAPEDAQRVIAVLPDGEIKKLEYNFGSRRWEGRFDIPVYAAEGDYAIRIIIVSKDGARKLLGMSYKVDVTPPAGSGSAVLIGSPGNKIRLAITADDDTARVTALLSDKQRVDLTRSAIDARQFHAVIDWREHEKPETVTFVLTDKAHNRMTVTVELSEGE